MPELGRHRRGSCTCRGLVESIDEILSMPIPEAPYSPEEIRPVRPMPSRGWFIAIAFLLPLMAGAVVAMVNGAARSEERRVGKEC